MQAHNLSARVMSPELQVFQVPKTDTSMLGVRFTQLRPVTTGINPMEFLIPATETFIDLGRSYFEMEVQDQRGRQHGVQHGPVSCDQYGAFHDQTVVRPRQWCALGTPDGSLLLQSLLPDHPEQQSERWRDQSTSTRLVQRFRFTSTLDGRRGR